MRLDIIHKSSIGRILLGNLTIQVTAILQTIILARALGPEGKGIITEITLWPTIIAGFSILGLYTGIVKSVAKNNIYNHYNFSRTILQLTSLLGLAGAFVAALCSFYYFKDNSYVLKIALFFSSFVIANNIARGFVAVDHGRKDFKSYSITRAILNPLFFVIIFVLWLFRALSIATAAYALLAANFLVAILRVILGFKKEDSTKAVFPAKWLLNYSIKFAPADFSEPIYAYYDKAIVALVLTSYDLGIYTVAYSTAALILILPNVYSTKIFSDVAGGDSIQSALTSVRQSFILMIVAGVFFAFIMPFLLPFVVGAQFNEAVLPAITLLLVCCAKGLSIILERAILAKGYPFVGIVAKIITMVLFGLLSGILKILKLESLMSLVLISIITQTVYLIYLIIKMRVLFHVKVSILPRRADLKAVVANIKNILQ